MCDRSRISSPKRRSGLSVPKRSMASACEKRGKGVPVTCQSLNSWNRPENSSSTTAKTSSCSTKAISMSHW